MSSASANRPPIWLIFAVTVTGITANSLVIPAVPDILIGLGAEERAAGVLVAAATMPGVIFAPTVGVLADRFGRRAVLVPCLVVFGVAGAAGGLAPSLPVLVGLRLLQGAGAAGLINLGVVLIGDHWTGRERVALIGRNAAVLTVSLAILPAIGGFVTDSFGWRAPFALYATALLTAAVVARRLPRSGTSDVSIVSQLREAAAYLRSRVMAATILGGFVTFILIFGAVLTVLPLFARAEFGLSAGARGVLLGLPAVASTAAAASLARLVSRLGRTVVLTAAPVLFAAAFLLLGWSPTLLVVGAGVILYGIGEGLIIPSLQDAASGHAPESARGTVFAAWVGAARLGQTVGPVLATAALVAGGARPTFLAAAVLSAALAGVMFTAARAITATAATRDG